MEKYLKPKKALPVGLCDDEIRKRILANTAVLFPTSHAADYDQLYEIVYGSSPYISGRGWAGDGKNSQYAMVVRRDLNGGHTPLIKGHIWAPSVPWITVLQGLLDTTAAMIHKTIGQAPLPQPGILEELPRYVPPSGETDGQTAELATSVSVH